MQLNIERCRNERPVDTDVLQVAANFCFNLSTDFLCIPAFHDAGDDDRDLAPIAHHRGARDSATTRLTSVGRGRAPHALAERNRYAGGWASRQSTARVGFSAVRVRMVQKRAGERPFLKCRRQSRINVLPIGDGYGMSEVAESDPEALHRTGDEAHGPDA